MVMLIAMLMAFLFGQIARAAPPAEADPALAPWFHSLQTQNGLSCCSTADCRGTKDYPVRVTEDGYEVFADHQWMKVPPSAVSNRIDNPTGDYVTCVQEEYRLNGIRTPQILCLFKAPGT